MKHCANIPIFVPHAGCPNACIFCDQRTISGAQAAPGPAQAAGLCRSALAGLPAGIKTVEIAFFGGSFTAIPRGQMVALLEAVQPFLADPRAAGIRVSTRPDAIDPQVLALLRRYGVAAVELGVQSMDDTVLDKNRRGHTAAQTAEASRLIRGAGLELGHQIMLGMYGDTPEGFLRTVEASIALRPATARIYPVTVLPGTGLEQLWRRGAYQPPTLAEAVELGAQALRRYTAAGVRVIRMGLHATPELETRRVAGVYHPAFRELCESRVLLDAALEQVSERPAGPCTAVVAVGARSKMTGQRRCNLAALQQAGHPAAVREDARLGYLQVIVE